MDGTGLSQNISPLNANSELPAPLQNMLLMPKFNNRRWYNFLFPASNLFQVSYDDDFNKVSLYNIMFSCKSILQLSYICVIQFSRYVHFYQQNVKL